MAVPGNTVVSALARELALDGTRPLVTFYDGATGERVELSIRTVENWATKIANLLAGDLLVDPGSGLRIDMPAHWQSTVTALGAWAAGLVIVMPGGATSVAASVVGPPSGDGGVEAHGGEVIACSLRPMGGRFSEPLPAGWLDFAVEVPSQPDLLLLPRQVRPDDVAVDLSTGPLTHDALAERARATMADLGIQPGGRLVTDANPASASGLVSALVGPLVTGASLVVVTNADAANRERIADQERATAADWLG